VVNQPDKEMLTAGKNMHVHKIVSVEAVDIDGAYELIFCFP
jgi:hypothetical protein